ncbi:MAG: Uma2 family endonuclease [Chloroflexota bacterium]|nr:Uma2 family endonuclease [Chloroflexota bacterium]
MVTEIAERLVSIDEFLEWESQQPFKNELINNRVIEMTGASRPHNRINLNLARALEDQLQSKGCEVYALEVGVLVNLEGTYTYPDLIVVCGEQRVRAEAPQASLENPTLLFEVLSPSTERYDRNQKLEQYLRIPSLLGYFLVAQDKPHIEAHICSSGDWLRHEFAGLDSKLVIDRPYCEVPLSDIYRRVQFGAV